MLTDLLKFKEKHPTEAARQMMIMHLAAIEETFASSRSPQESKKLMNRVASQLRMIVNDYRGRMATVPSIYISDQLGQRARHLDYYALTQEMRALANTLAQLTDYRDGAHE
jgi:hypothetical protein